MVKPVRTLYDVVVDAVVEAGDYVFSKLGDAGAVTAKSSKDFVSEVDKEAERRIIVRINTAFPEVAIFGEETGHHQGTGPASDAITIVLDPLDATTNFLKGIPLFDIAAAVYERDTLMFGVVYCPRLGELYTAQKGMGAKCNGKAIMANAIDDINKALIGYNRSNHPDAIIPSSKKLLSLILEHAMSIRIFGTGALDYCYSRTAVLMRASRRLPRSSTARATSSWKKLERK